jgi:hypothetical protein
MPSPQPPPLRFLIIRLAGRDFAIPAARLCGMMLFNTADLSATDRCGPLRFSLQLESRSLPVLVPHALLGLEERKPSSRSCLLLVRDPARHASSAPSDAAFALAVDSVSRLEEVPPSRYRAPGLIRLGETWRDVLDPDQLYRAALASPSSRTTKESATAAF